MALNDPHDVARFLIEILMRHEDGAIMTSHRPATEQDAEVIKNWPSEGLYQVAHAFLIEYLRRESYVMAMTMLSRGSDLESLSPTALRDRVHMQVVGMVNQYGLGAAEEALDRIKAHVSDAES